MDNKSQIITDIITVILCLAGAVFCIILFQQDLNAMLMRQGETPIGEISYRYNSAQRRFIDRLIWDRLRKGTPLYNGDLIRTANMSEIVLSFSFGDLIELHANTLVQIFADHTGIRIDFARGGITVISSSENGVVVTSGNKRVVIEPGAVLRAISNSNGNLNLTVNEGEVFLEDLFNALGTGEVIPLTAGSYVNLDSSGQIINSIDPNAVPVYPVSGTQILTTAVSTDVPFVWNNLQYTENTLTRLEIARDRNFKRLVYSGNLSGNNFVHRMEEGIFFWRIYPAGTQPDENQYSRLSIIRTASPNLITPLDKQEISYRSRVPSVRFQWTASPEAAAYNLEVANNDYFLNPAVKVQVRAGSGDYESYVTSSLKEGSWFWRVTPVFAKGFVKAVDFDAEKPAPSEQLVPSERSFSLISTPFVAAPVLIAPANFAFFNVEAGRKNLLFSWKKDNEAASYTFRLSKNNDMSSPVIEHTTQENFYRYGLDETAITSGEWFWSVFYTGHDDAVSLVSEVRTLNAVFGEVVQRLVFPPNNYVIADTFLTDTRFTWRTNLLDNRFQVSKNENFSELLINERIATESYTIRDIEIGEYYWRITGVTSTTEELITGSGRRFAVTDSLPPSAVLSVDSGVAAAAGNVVVRRGIRVNFNWQTIPGAEYYVFKMHKGDASTSPIMETVVFDNKISINMDDYEEGAYTWTVQGLARASSEQSRRTGLAAEQAINVRQLRPIVIQHPRDGFVYTGIDASRRPDTARWFTPERAVNTRFVIARDARMRDIVHQLSVSNMNFTLPRLNDGNFYWMIRGETIEGYDISSQPANFTVSPIPRLAVPLNRIPADRHTIGAKDIAASRAVNFSWAPVKDATAYIVTVFQGTGRSRRTVVESQPIRGTTYSIEDIRLLGRGTFSWQVEALNILEDGFIEQRGELAENRLTVDIPVPRNVRTRDSGVLYGL